MALTRFLKPKELITQRTCKLKSLTPELDDILLDDKKVEIGRSRKTGISNTFCSKQQITVKADLSNCVISIKVNGPNPSGLNGFMLEQGKGYEAFHDDIIELLYNELKFRVEFDPKPTPSSTLKKPRDSENEEEFPAKKMKMSDSSTKGGVWESIDNGKLLVFRHNGQKASTKIAAFDMDGTLIKTKSGNVFAKTLDDWQISFPEVPAKLKSLQNNGYKIIIFTNQAAISKGTLHVADIKFKIEAIISKLGVPIQVFISTGKGRYRKPVTGMWEYLQDKENDGLAIDMKSSVYVGDAAGRPEQKTPVKRKKDHSWADRLFALNVGVPFYTPEEYFLNHKTEKWVQPDFNPHTYKRNNIYEPQSTKVPSPKTEVIIMMGLPGTGKSFFANNTLAPLGYTVVNRDQLGSAEKCVKLCESSLQAGKRCVIDNTNGDTASRARFIEIAKKFNVQCRCFVMDVSWDHLRHNIAFRHLTDSKHVKIDERVLYTLRKKTQDPTVGEGFKEVVKVNLIPVLKNAEQEKLYKMYLLEK